MPRLRAVEMSICRPIFGYNRLSKVVVKILKYEAVNNFFLINISIIDIYKI
jgi:hypothetical protein